MTRRKDDAPRRSVTLEFEVPGTPDQVWRAIATGPGISAWFVPTEVEEGPGGAVAFHLGPDMISTGHITAWEPPRRVTYEEPGWMDGAPPLATEFVIEAKSGGTCTIRLVHSLFADSDDWDDELNSMETGWPAFFKVLEIYLGHFADAPAASIRPTTTGQGSADTIWQSLLQQLGLEGMRLGEYRRIAGSSSDSAAGAGVPVLAGTAEDFGTARQPHALTLRLDQPAPGVALLGTYEWDGAVHTAVSIYFYGQGAEAVAEREARAWQNWLDARIGPAGGG